MACIFCQGESVVLRVEILCASFWTVVIRLNPGGINGSEDALLHEQSGSQGDIATIC